MLAAVMQETLPDAAELVTPPHRSSSVGDSLGTSSSTAAAAAGAGTGASAAAGAAAAQQGLSQPRPPYTLREGVGMRRLLKFRVAAGVQLLLVQAASEMYAQQYMHLGVSDWVGVGHGLGVVCQHTALP
jgi:brefeldin A-inhibited guanine nucleotide-exchange protein